MERSEHIGLQQAREDWMPQNVLRDMQLFNVFSLREPNGPFINCKPYDRKGYYKISILKGPTRFFYADKSVEVKRCALLFTSPTIPYSWEHLEGEQSGYFCVFKEAFFDQFGQIKEYPVFKPGNVPIFELSPEIENRIISVFQRMQEEIASVYSYKYDLIRNLVMEVIHMALKMQPSESNIYFGSTGITRTTSLFAELLERQFPIESSHHRLELRHPSAYADQLSIHVNSLNRAVKEVTGKTTSQLISERIAQEARILLKHTDWTISEIGWCLGFDELSHFIKFFKKIEVLTPNSFRSKNGF